MKNKKIICILVLISIILILVGVIFYVLDNRNNSFEKNMFSEVYDWSDELIFGIKNGEYGVYDYDGLLVEKIADDSDVILSKYGYYFVVNGKNQLVKRAGKIVKEEKILDEDYGLKLYKDESDSNSKYIDNSLLISVDELDQSGLDSNIVAINIDDSKNTIIYDNNTGEILNNEYHLKEVLFNSDIISDRYYASVNSDNTYGLFDKKDLKIVFDGYDGIGDDEYSLDLGINLYNSKYVAASKSNKFGVIDFSGKVIIPFEYQKIRFLSDNSKYVAAMNNDKFGLLDLTGKVVLPFEYSCILVLDDYIVTLKDSQVTILDNSLQKKSNDYICSCNLEDVNFYDAGIWHEKGDTLDVIYGNCDNKKEYLFSILDDKIIDNVPILETTNYSVSKKDFRFFSITDNKIDFYDNKLNQILETKFSEPLDLSEYRFIYVTILNDDNFLVEVYSKNKMNVQRYLFDFLGNVPEKLIDNDQILLRKQKNRFFTIDDIYSYVIVDDFKMDLYKEDKNIATIDGISIAHMKDNLFLVEIKDGYIIKKI